MRTCTMWIFAPCDAASDTANEKARAAQTEKSVPTRMFLSRAGFFDIAVTSCIRAGAA